MSEVKRRYDKIKNDKEKGKVGVERRRSTGNNVQKDSKILTYKKGHEKIVNPERIPGNGDPKGNESFDKNKETSGHRAGSILVHSTPKPESRMTTFEKMEATRKGISKKELEELKKRAGLDYDQLSHILQVARATLIAKKGSEKFPALLSEKIMSVADIYSYGYDVFGSEQEFNKWIFQPIIALRGKSPYEIMDNVYGREEVKHIIGRIEYGVYS